MLYGQNAQVDRMLCSAYFPLYTFKICLCAHFTQFLLPYVQESGTTANLAVPQTGTTDPKSRDVSFRRWRPDMQSCTLLGAYILLVLNSAMRLVVFFYLNSLNVQPNLPSHQRVATLWYLQGMKKTWVAILSFSLWVFEYCKSRKFSKQETLVKLWCQHFISRKLS